LLFLDRPLATPHLMFLLSPRFFFFSPTCSLRFYEKLSTVRGTVLVPPLRSVVDISFSAFLRPSRALFFPTFLIYSNNGLRHLTPLPLSRSSNAAEIGRSFLLQSSHPHFPLLLVNGTFLLPLLIGDLLGSFRSCVLGSRIFHLLFTTRPRVAFLSFSRSLQVDPDSAIPYLLPAFLHGVSHRNTTLFPCFER